MGKSVKRKLKLDGVLGKSGWEVNDRVVGRRGCASKFNLLYLTAERILI